MRTRSVSLPFRIQFPVVFLVDFDAEDCVLLLPCRRFLLQLWRGRHPVVDYQRSSKRVHVVDINEVGGHELDTLFLGEAHGTLMGEDHVPLILGEGNHHGPEGGHAARPHLLLLVSSAGGHVSAYG